MLDTLRRLWTDVVCTAGQIPQGLRQIRRGERALLAKRAWEEIGAGTQSVVLSGTGDSELRSLPWPTADLRGAFAEDFFEVQAEALRSGRLAFAGGRRACSGGLFIRSNGLTLAHAYRCVDPRTLRVAYAICTDWNYRLHCIYFPSENVTVYGDRGMMQYGEAFLGAPPGLLILQEIAERFEELDDCLSAGINGYAAFYFYGHLGHHLWNELTGLAQLTGAGVLPPVFVAGAGMSECYGHLDCVFPQLEGRVDRSIASVSDIAGHCYRNRLGFVHPTGCHIGMELRRRLLTLAETAPECAGSVTLHDALRAEGFRIVVLGLRVENRTLVDLAGFCRGVVAMLKARLGRVAVIVDGHNSTNGGDGRYSSLWDHGADTVGAEITVLKALEAAFGADPDIRLVSTLGRSMALSLFWGRRAAFFVTPWGAGLAKYRWVCNLPGLFVSNPTFLRNPESGLYDDPRYLEHPARTWRIAPEDATDRPDVPVMVPIGDDPMRWNYDVDMGAMDRELGRVVGAVL